MKRQVVFSVLVLSCLAFGPSVSSAQVADPVTSTEVDEGAEHLRPASPRLAPSASILLFPTLARAQAPVVDGSLQPFTPLPQEARNRRGIPLLVAGGILFVAGAIAGGDAGALLMLGGAGVGAYGAYLYFGGD